MCAGEPTGGPTGGDDRIVAASSTRRGTPAQVLRAVLIGVILAAVFGSGPLLHWTEMLPDGRLAVALHDAAAWWNGMLSTLGIARPYEWLRRLTRAFEAMRF
jgi:hypothetical protein